MFTAAVLLIRVIKKSEATQQSNDSSMRKKFCVFLGQNTRQQVKEGSRHIKYLRRKIYAISRREKKATCTPIYTLLSHFTHISALIYACHMAACLALF